MDKYEKLLAPYQVQNGGNLILMQIENEFSSQRIGDCKTCPPNLVNIDYMQVWFRFCNVRVLCSNQRTEIKRPGSEKRDPYPLDAQQPEHVCKRVEY